MRALLKIAQVCEGEKMDQLPMTSSLVFHIVFLNETTIVANACPIHRTLLYLAAPLAS